MDVLIFGGQSNMQGQTEKLTGTEEIEGACEYRFVTDSFVPLKNPVGEDLRADGTGGPGSDESTDPESWLREFVLGASWCGNTNMVPSFCYAYIKATGRKVAAVHAAKGSTVIADWLPGTDGYKMVVKKTRAAVDKIRRDGGSIGSVYFMWLQGESDAIFSTLKEDYKSRMLELGEALRRDAGIDRFGVIRVGYFVNDERDVRIMEAQSETCAEHPELFLMLTEEAASMRDVPEMMNPYVGGHFSAAGQERLGTLAGTALGRFAVKR